MLAVLTCMGASHTALYRSMVACKRGGFEGDYGYVLEGRLPRPHSAPAEKYCKKHRSLWFIKKIASLTMVALQKLKTMKILENP